MTLKSAHQNFQKAQEVALENNDEVGEILAIGMAELAMGLQKELRAITSKLDDLERRVKRLD